MLEIKESDKQGKALFRVSGRLDATSVSILDHKLKEKYEEGSRHFVLDFQKLEYLSSAGMRLLLAFTKKLRLEDGSLKLSSLQKEILEIIKMGGFEQILHIYDNEQEALENDS